MKLVSLLILSLIFTGFSQDPEKLVSKAKLIFEDDFNRTEKDDSKEELGGKWKTNSAKRAKGVKQADLRNNALHIKMAKEADHAVSVLHTNPFDDGVVKVRFKMLDSKGLKFNYNDPKARKIAWAGHVCAVGVTPNGVQVVDQLTGQFRLDIRKMKKDGASKKEIAKLLKGKSITKKTKLKTGQWYDMTMVFQGAVLEVYIDGEKIIQLDSPGFDHKVKDNIAFSVSGEAEVDDLKVYSLD